MSNRYIAAAMAALVGSLITACSAADTRSEVVSGSATTSSSGAVTIPTESGGVTVPAAATGGTTGTGSGTAGPSEKEKQRGNTPPGTSRDGAGPAGGAIIDPSGAATGKR